MQSWRELDVPEGWRAEIDAGQIHLAPPPHPFHNEIAELLQRALYGVLPLEIGLYQTLGIRIGSLGRLYVPDLAMVPRRLVAGADPDVALPIDAAEALLVVEITSKSNADDDRKKKLWAYAHAPVPVSLLIDRFDPHGPTTTLFTNPENGVYKDSHRVAFGDVVELPKPFAVKIDTGSFPI
ncbi:Uma2 family endonuclease [Streptomyces sp. 12297]